MISLYNSPKPVFYFRDNSNVTGVATEFSKSSTIIDCRDHIYPVSSLTAHRLTTGEHKCGISVINVYANWTTRATSYFRNRYMKGIVGVV